MINKIIAGFYKIKPYILPYAVGIAIPLTVGIISAGLTRESMEVYETLNSPPLSPPPILFPIVWSLLYILMGISSAMIYTNKESNPTNAKKGLSWYAVSLIFNLSWSIIFL